MKDLTRKFLNWRRDKIKFYSLELKKNKTLPEKIFHPFAIHIGLKFEDRPFFQYVIHIDQIRKYIVDFYFPRHKIAVEIDGNSHDSIHAKYYDAKRTNLLNLRGIKVLRFHNNDIKNDFNRIKSIVSDSFKIFS